MAWTELQSTVVFLQTLRKQMTTKSRVKNGVVLLRLSFGRTKAGTEFQTEREMEDYVCLSFGDGISFSQNEIQNSPYNRWAQSRGMNVGTDLPAFLNWFCHSTKMRVANSTMGS